jgi:Lsr2.
MATQVQTTLIDDLDGSEASETIKFGLDGVLYEIDLSQKNADKLRKAIAPFKEAARKATPPSKERSGGRSRSRNDLADIREWAKENGFAVSDRGRVARDVIEAYDAAHGR